MAEAQPSYSTAFAVWQRHTSDPMSAAGGVCNEHSYTACQWPHATLPMQRSTVITVSMDSTGSGGGGGRKDQ